jgi:apolipoprotein N-acyltransferase
MNEKKISPAAVPAGAMLSLVSGVLLVISFPPLSLSWCAWFALAPLFVAVMKLAPTRRAFGLYFAIAYSVWLFGMIIGVPAGYRILFAAPVAVFIVVYLWFFWQKELMTGNNFKYFTVLAACGIVGFEYVRQISPFSIFASLGLTQYRHPEFIQIASLFGVFGVSFMIVIVNCVIALAVANYDSIGKVKPQLIANVIIAVVLIALNYSMLKQPLRQEGTVRAAAVQFGYVPDAKLHPGVEKWASYEKVLDSMGATNEAINLLAPLSEQAARKGAQLIVWPEVMLSVDPQKYPAVAERLSQLAIKTRAYLVVPFSSYPPGKEKIKGYPHENALYIIAPDGKFVYRYVKQIRVTSFGIEAGPVGNKTEVFPSAIGKLAMMICYDADYKNIPETYAKKSAELFVLPSHDLAGFLTRYHPYMLQFRAVEHHKSLVKSDFVQGSIIVDPKGRLLKDPPDGLNISVADVPLMSEQTPYSWLSIVFGVGCCVVFVGALIASGMEKKK